MKQKQAKRVILTTKELIKESTMLTDTDIKV